MRNSAGQFCPEHENRPHTPTGRAVAALIDRPGLWKRAGLTGALCGLDMREALASLPRGVDRERARKYLAIAEIEFLVAWRDAQPKTPDVTK